MQNRRSFLLRVGGLLGAAICGLPQAPAGRWDIRISRLAVADDEVYSFADPKFIGKSYTVEHTTKYIPQRNYAALTIPFGRIPERTIIGDPVAVPLPGIPPRRFLDSPTKILQRIAS